MAERPAADPEETIGFWGSWNRLYLFVVTYGVLQIVLLYLFTRAFNHS